MAQGSKEEFSLALGASAVVGACALQAKRRQSRGIIEQLNSYALDSVESEHIS